MLGKDDIAKRVDPLEIEDPFSKDTDRLLGSKSPNFHEVKIHEETPKTYCTKLFICFFGLQVSYVTWGAIQERIMRTPYGDSHMMFPSSSFLVCSNRFLAILVAIFMCWYKHGKFLGNASLWNYAPCSMTNVISSWAQYEALKYISFPIQVLSKSCKIIPVMLVGKMIHHTVYKWSEIFEALSIVIGISMFMLGEKKPPDESKSDSFYGLFLLALYLCCDSFTGQWQSKIYKQHKVDQYHMMFAVNLFSIGFTLFSLIVQNELYSSIAFIKVFPIAGLHVFILSLTSATGQLFIYYTLKKFGPILFTIMMTTRQMLSMILSFILYGHIPGFMGIFGATIVFIAIFYGLQHRFYESHAKS